MKGLKINIPARMKNVTFWVSIALAVLVPIGSYYGITGSDMTTWKSVWDTFILAISNPYVVVMILVSIYNTVIDPTTKGIGDSEKALTYTKPN